MKNPSVLGALTPKQFLQDYWQKKPLLIRQAIPNIQPVLTREALFALAARDDTETRLITHFRQQWKMQHGPHHQLPTSGQKNWTLLVQGVNLHDDQADKLLREFRFLSDSRLDDLMISYGTDGGGVGAHIDSYDVFLLQAHGRRRWRIGAQKDLSIKESLPLKILRTFTPDQEFILEPGDMLYLPPQYAHEGVAIGECMTYSIGFRSPAWQEMGEAFLQFMADSIDLPGRYADPALQDGQPPAKISDHLMAAVSTELAKLASKPEDMAIFLGQYLTEPKATVFFDPPLLPQSAARFSAAAARRGLKLHRKTRMLYHGKQLFINGESFQPGRADQVLLQAFANQRTLTPESFSKSSIDLQESLYSWYLDGWIGLP